MHCTHRRRQKSLLTGIPTQSTNGRLKWPPNRNGDNRPESQGGRGTAPDRQQKPDRRMADHPLAALRFLESH